MIPNIDEFLLEYRSKHNEPNNQCCFDNTCINENISEYIPTPLSKQYIYAHNLKNMNTREVNHQKLIYFVLALRYFKNYDIRVEEASEFKFYNVFTSKNLTSNELFYLIYLNDELFAMSSIYGQFYTNDIMLGRQSKTLGYFINDLEKCSFIQKLNKTEKIILKTWLLNLNEMLDITKSIEHLLLSDMLNELNDIYIKDKIINKDSILGNEIGRNLLPAGMSYTVISYHEDLYSDLFLRNTQANEQVSKYLLLDNQLLKQSLESDKLTFLNHVRVFEIKNRFKTMDDLKWMLSHEYKLNMQTDIEIIFDTSIYFLKKLYKVDLQDISQSNLYYRDSNLLYPINYKLFNIYQFDWMYECTDVSEQDEALIFSFKWVLEGITYISETVYDKSEIVDMSKNEISIKVFPESETEGIDCYEVEYSGATEMLEMYPLNYFDKTPNCYLTSEFPNIHFLMESNNICGFVEVEPKNDSSQYREEKVYISLKFYDNKLTYYYTLTNKPKQEECDFGNLIRNNDNHHLMYYKADYNNQDNTIIMENCKYIDDNNLNIMKLNIDYLNDAKDHKIIYKYHWTFDGSQLFQQTIKDIEDYVRRIFISFAIKGYKTSNVIWQLDYTSISPFVINELIESNITKIIAKVISAVKIDKQSAFYRDENIRKRYIDNNISFLKFDNTMKFLERKYNINPSHMIDIFVSDNIIYSNKSTDTKKHKLNPLIKVDNGLLNILKIFSKVGKDQLELFMLDKYYSELNKIEEPVYKGLILSNISKFEFDTDNTIYGKHHQELFYIISLLVLNSIAQVCKNLSKQSDKKVLVITLDKDSVILGLLEKICDISYWIKIISETIGKIIDSELIITGFDYNNNTYSKSYIGTVCNLTEDSVEEHLSKLLSENLNMKYDEAFIKRFKNKVAINKLNDSITYIRNTIVAASSYKYEKYSQLKLIPIKKYKNNNMLPEDGIWGQGIYLDFIGEKKLFFIKKGDNKKTDCDYQKLFKIIDLGKATDFNNADIILLLPAIVDKANVIEQGVIIIMDESINYKRPKLTIEDFKELNKENAEIVAESFKTFFDYIEKRYIENNQIREVELERLTTKVNEQDVLITNLESFVRSTKGEKVKRENPSTTSEKRIEKKVEIKQTISYSYENKRESIEAIDMEYRKKYISMIRDQLLQIMKI